MKTICLYFEIHQIVHLKRYRFFDIGTDHYYYDDYENERSINHIAECSYMPALNTLQKMIQDSNGYFKCAFSISGVGMEQLEVHAPQVLDKLQELNKTGCVEFLAEPYSHGLSSLKDSECFAADVRKQCKKMVDYFGHKPTVLAQLLAHLQRRHRTAGRTARVQRDAYRGSQTRARMEITTLCLQLRHGS